MTTISIIRARLRAIVVNEEARLAIEKTKERVADLNRDRMLVGRRADGSVMPNYSYVSVSVYGYPPGPIRLKATGAFQAAIKITVTERTIIEYSSDSKTEMLVKRYGDAIFGLDKEGRIEYVKELRPVFVNQVRGKLKL